MQALLCTCCALVDVVGHAAAAAASAATAAGCQGVAKLTRLLLARAQPKRIGFVPVSGVMLAGLAEAYVAAINEGAVPTIATAWQVCTRQWACSSAMKELWGQVFCWQLVTGVEQHGHA